MAIHLTIGRDNFSLDFYAPNAYNTYVNIGYTTSNTFNNMIEGGEQ